MSNPIKIINKDKCCSDMIDMSNPPIIPKTLLPLDLEVSNDNSFVTATWIYVCINCHKRFYHYALSKPSVINIKLMNCCEKPLIKFEHRHIRCTKP